MPSAGGPSGPSDVDPEPGLPPSEGVERQLFESLVHHLIEKGVLTKNDALSVVQTVAEVKRGELETDRSDGASIKRELLILERLYASFELVSTFKKPVYDDRKVLQLRPPLHDDNPRFPQDE